MHALLKVACFGQQTGRDKQIHLREYSTKKLQPRVLGKPFFKHLLSIYGSWKYSNSPYFILLMTQRTLNTEHIHSH